MNQSVAYVPPDAQPQGWRSGTGAVPRRGRSAAGSTSGAMQAGGGLGVAAFGRRGIASSAALSRSGQRAWTARLSYQRMKSQQRKRIPVATTAAP
jgi:hypothetical protein